MSVNLSRGAVRIRAARPSRGHVGAARRVAERGRVVDHPIDVAADRLRQRVGAERVAVGHPDAGQPVLAQQAARVAEAPARVARAGQRDGDGVEVDEAVAVGLRQVGEGRSVVEAHVRVDDDLRAGVRGRWQGDADDHREEQDGGTHGVRRIVTAGVEAGNPRILGSTATP